MRSPAKSTGPTYRPISDVSDELGERQNVLRWWESQFHQVRPMRTPSGSRRYDRPTIDLLRGIQRLLRIEGLSIAGVQQVLEQQGPAFVRAIGGRRDGQSERAAVRRRERLNARPEAT